jgi:hypothetical protein
MSGQLHAPAALPPLDRRLGGPQSRSGRCGEKRKFLTLPGLELRPLSRPARSRSLWRLSYPGSKETSRIILKLPLYALSDTLVGIATDYGLDGWGSIPDGASLFSSQCLDRL